MVKSKSSVFILPMILEIPFKTFAGFENVFIGTSNMEDLSDLHIEQRRIYVVFRVEDLEKPYFELKGGHVVNNRERLEAFKTHKQFVSELSFGSYVAFEFVPLESYVDDFDRFKSGLYSKFSSKYKRIIKHMYTQESVKNIISPTDEERKKLGKELEHALPKDCEILSAPKVLEENLSPAKFIELID